MTELDKWDSFYVIVGSAAGALIGLQFVVMTLIAERPSQRVAAASAAFSTPTIVHFCVVLALSAIIRAPWESMASITLAGGIVGAAGMIYALITAWRIGRQSAYKPDFEDWTFHGVLPVAAYAILTTTALFASSDLHDTMFVVAGAILLLLFISIHNAWDAVAYQVLVIRARQGTENAVGIEPAQSDGAGGRT